MLDSIKGYFDVIVKDLTRNGITVRKHFLESLSAPSMSSKDLAELAGFLGVRRKAVSAAADGRAKLEEDQLLQPFAERMARKQPVGEKVVTLDWKLKAGEFFESDSISDVIKGHHKLYKVPRF